MTKSEQPLVRDLMTAEPRTCRSHDSGEHCARLMWEHACGAIVVLDDGGTPVSMITDRDLCMAAWTQGKKLAEIVVGSAMSERLLTTRQGETVASAEAKMRRYGVRRLVVLDARGGLVGVLSFDDVARRANVGPIGIHDHALSAEVIASTVSALAHAMKDA